MDSTTETLVIVFWTDYDPRRGGTPWNADRWHPSSDGKWVQLFKDDVWVADLKADLVRAIRLGVREMADV